MKNKPIDADINRFVPVLMFIVASLLFLYPGGLETILLFMGFILLVAFIFGIRISWVRKEGKHEAKLLVSALLIFSSLCLVSIRLNMEITTMDDHLFYLAKAEQTYLHTNILCGGDRMNCYRFQNDVFEYKDFTANLLNLSYIVSFIGLMMFGLRGTFARSTSFLTLRLLRRVSVLPTLLILANLIAVAVFLPSYVKERSDLRSIPTGIKLLI
jgi:hypothetical protein